MSRLTAWRVGSLLHNLSEYLGLTFRYHILLLKTPRSFIIYFAIQICTNNVVTTTEEKTTSRTTTNFSADIAAAAATVPVYVWPTVIIVIVAVIMVTILAIFIFWFWKTKRRKYVHWSTNRILLRKCDVDMDSISLGDAVKGCISYQFRKSPCLFSLALPTLLF